MEIAALPSCEKSLFAGAKVAFFLENESHRHSMPYPDNPSLDRRGVIISIYREFTRPVEFPFPFQSSHQSRSRVLRPVGIPHSIAGYSPSGWQSCSLNPPAWIQ